MDKELRWKQRFINFEKAFLLLERTLQINEPSEAELGGLIKFYEMSFELSWKLMKDYLEEQGFIVKSPRETIKQAFQTEIITQGENWINALEDRNMTSHVYDEKMVILVIDKIRHSYFELLKDLYYFFKKENEQ
jgi:nucleotidyltransferase substrate binding protein (TIGR01987 family)